MTIDLEYIKEFVELAKVGNFLEAAENLYISQSTLSKHIKALEDELHVHLFDRTTRTVKLSIYGQAFLIYAKQMEKSMELALQTLAEMKETTFATIGCIPSMAQYNFTDILYKFQKDNKNLHLNIINSDTINLIKQLENGEIELAFIRETANENPYLNRLNCATDKLKVVLPISHKYAGNTSVSLDMLKDEDFISFPDDTMMYKLCRELCLDAGFEMHTLFSCHNIDNIADFVIKGFGVSLLMDGQTRFLQNPRLSIIDIEPEIQTFINLCWHKEHELSMFAKQFIESAKLHWQTANDSKI